MSWNGSGSFTRIFGASGWTNDKNSSVNILSSRHDTHDQDIADGINLCLTKDNQSKPAATIAPNLANTYDLGTTALSWRSFIGNALKLLNSGFTSTIQAGTLTANRTVTLPDTDGAIALSVSAIKTANLPRSGVTALTDDPDLTVPLDASSRYEITVHLPFNDNWSSGTHPGIVYGLAYTGTITKFVVSTFGVINSTAVNPAPWINISSQFSQSVLTGSSLPECMKIHGSIITNAAGNLKVQWCQFNNAGTTTMLAGALIRCNKVP